MAEKIYTDDKYGLDKPQTLKNWIEITDSIDEQKYLLMPFYQGLISELGLRKDQVLYIAGPRSSIYGMLIAIKSALK